jgi:hypothetical protein
LAFEFKRRSMMRAFWVLASLFDGRIEFYQQTHPAVFVESCGHGIYGARSAISRLLLPYCASASLAYFGVGTGPSLLRLPGVETARVVVSRDNS